MVFILILIARCRLRVYFIVSQCSATAIDKVLTGPVLEVERAGTSQFQVPLPQFVGSVGHIDIGISRRCL